MRRAAALVSYHLLLALLVAASNPPGEIARRVRFVSASAPRDPAVRRLSGSSTAFDRRYFAFLEAARRRLPPGTRGVALFLEQPGDAPLYLAAYHLAPLPVRVAPGSVPPGWVGAAYGEPRPSGWREVARLPGGALLLPVP